MTEPLIGFSIASTMTVALVILYRVEDKRGRRFFKFFRERLDFLVLKIEHGLRVFFSIFARGVVRQTLHYIFHAAVSVFLFLLERAERALKEILRTNRAFAKRTQTERTTRNKLDEIALHKIEMALSEEEKKRRRDKALKG